MRVRGIGVAVITEHIRRRLARRQAAALRDAEFVLFIDHDQAGFSNPSGS